MSGTLIDLLILLGVLCIVLVAGWYILSQVQLTDPVRKIVLIAFVVIVAVVACILLLRLGSGRFVARHDVPSIATVPPPQTKIPRESNG
jgi:hypothetical protein